VACRLRWVYRLLWAALLWAVLHQWEVEVVLPQAVPCLHPHWVVVVVLLLPRWEEAL